LTSPLYEIIYRYDWFFCVRPAAVFVHVGPVRNCVMVIISPASCVTVTFGGGGQVHF